jgi:hypothetical protein
MAQARRSGRRSCVPSGAAFAIVSASQRAHRQPPLGPVNGLLYWLQKHARRKLFDIVSGSDRYDPRVPGRTAKPGYDLASGLGVPQFKQLAAALPPPANDHQAG